MSGPGHPNLLGQTLPLPALHSCQFLLGQVKDQPVLQLVLKRASCCSRLSDLAEGP